MENNPGVPPKIECRIATQPNNCSSEHKGMERVERKGHVNSDVYIHNSQEVDAIQMPPSRQKDIKDVYAHTMLTLKKE